MEESRARGEPAGAPLIGASPAGRSPHAGRDSQSIPAVAWTNQRRAYCPHTFVKGNQKTAERSRAEPNRAERSRAEPSGAERSRAEPSGAERSRVQPVVHVDKNK
ncbi:hypothetical protein EYF80_046530 [Liparis tanakae]|uniref:Uncharacterized protein n=1 Tax=Liparis tanakae TaxID=230148 RepID=A0A4Z2FQZ1_9TELE|nr:hypothetical protein EYF80_046530 [Liparis tanakae]